MREAVLRWETVMVISRRAYRGETDSSLIGEFMKSMPLTCRHLIDLPWRLSSPAAEAGRNACIWEDDNGKVIGFAAWQVYWASLDFFVYRGPQRQAVETAIFSWATERFRELDQERGKPLPYWVEYRDDDLERRRLAEAHGFLLDEEIYVQFEHSFSESLPTPELPDGFSLRPLAGEQEVSAYAELHRAAFASTSMTADWRARTLRMPQYRPELDLVVVAPNNDLAGFCVGWLDQERHIGQIEPMGIYPHFQKLGLSRALLLEILRRFKEHGAAYALVETDLERSTARHAYESAGFRPVHSIRSKGKWVSQAT